MFESIVNIKINRLVINSYSKEYKIVSEKNIVISNTSLANDPVRIRPRFFITNETRTCYEIEELYARKVVVGKGNLIINKKYYYTNEQLPDSLKGVIEIENSVVENDAAKR